NVPFLLRSQGEVSPQGGLDASVRLAAAGLYPAVSPGKTDN
ncbi:hypothetical protein ACQSG4_27375, partial [Klebsiella pneumoniae]